MKQKREIGVLVVLLAIAGMVWLWNFQGRPTITTGVGAVNRQNYPPIPVDNPIPRTDLIERARSAQYNSSGRNIFSYAAQAPDPSGPHHPDTPTVTKTPCGIDSGPCLPPPPPPLVLPPNLKFYGYGIVPNGTSRRAFFHDSNDDKVYVVAEGELLLNRYRILRIGNASLEFQELASGRVGTAPLEEQGGPQ